MSLGCPRLQAFGCNICGEKGRIKNNVEFEDSNKNTEDNDDERFKK